MPEIIMPLGDAIDTVLSTIRKRIVDAKANGQHVRMVARESAQQVMSTRDFRRKTLDELVASTPPDGGFEIHIYIEPKR